MKISKKIIALALVFIMAAAALCGCTSKKAQSLGQVMKDAVNEKSARMTCTVTGEIDGVSGEGKIVSTVNGENTAIDFSATAAGTTFDIKNAVVAADKKIYLNAGEIVSQFKGIAGLVAGNTVSSLLSKLDGLGYVYMDYSNTDVSREKVADVALFDFDKTFENIIKQENGEYIISIESDADVKTLLGDVAAYIELNADKWAEEATKYLSADKIKAEAEKVFDSLSKEFESVLGPIMSMFSKDGAGLNIDEIKKQLMGSLDEYLKKANLGSLSKDDIAAKLKEAAAAIKSRDVKIGGFKFKFTAKPETGKTTFTVDIETTEMEKPVKLNATIVIEKIDPVEIKAPDNAKSLEESIKTIVPSLIDNLKKNLSNFSFLGF